MLTTSEYNSKYRAKTEQYASMDNKPLELYKANAGRSRCRQEHKPTSNPYKSTIEETCFAPTINNSCKPGGQYKTVSKICYTGEPCENSNNPGTVADHYVLERTKALS